MQAQPCVVLGMISVSPEIKSHSFLSGIEGETLSQKYICTLPLNRKGESRELL